jgi:hypothetical protein
VQVDRVRVRIDRVEVGRVRVGRDWVRIDRVEAGRDWVRIDPADRMVDGPHGRDQIGPPRARLVPETGRIDPGRRIGPADRMVGPIGPADQMDGPIGPADRMDGPIGREPERTDRAPTGPSLRVDCDRIARTSTARRTLRPAGRRTSRDRPTTPPSTTARR